MCRRTLVVDDSPVFLSSVVAVLEAAEEIEVVGTAASGREALERVQELKPDIVLMDIGMPEMGGLEVTRRLAEQPSRPRIILMTLHAQKPYREAAMRAGADGFLSKSDLDLGLLPLIRTFSPDNGRNGSDGNGMP